MRKLIFAALCLIGCGEPEIPQPCLGGQSFDGWHSVLDSSRFDFDPECPSRLNLYLYPYGEALVYFVKPWPPSHAWLTASITTNCPASSELTMAIGLDRGYYPVVTSQIERTSDQTNGFGLAFSIRSPEACALTLQQVWLVTSPLRK